MENKEKVKECNRRYYQKHRERLKECSRRHHQEHKDKDNEVCRQYHTANREGILARQKQYYQQNKEELYDRNRPYQKEYYQEHKKSYGENSRKRIELHKQRCIEYLGGYCKICGKSTEVYDFHHRDPKTKCFEIGRSYYMAWEKIVQELDKCDLLCCICHRKLHASFVLKPCRTTIKNRDILRRAVNYLGGSCKACGLKDDPVVYDFHHRDPSQKESKVSEMHGRWDDLLVELNKCDLLCCTCHRKYHVGLIVLVAGEYVCS